MASIQSLGVGSGLLTSELVEQIIEAERAPVTARLDQKQTIAEAKISAYGEITSALSSFDASLQSLKLPSTFNASTVASSNESTVSGTASSLAVAGNYTVNVSQLAQAHSVASGSYAEVSSTVGTGTLNFRFGTTTYGGGGSYDGFTLNADAASKSIVITSANNTLAGIRDAVNKGNFGVQASIVDDGSGFRLVFSGKNSGAKNSIEVTASGTDGLKALNYNQTSQNANLVATTATGALDLSTGGGLDLNSLAFSLSYKGVAMDVVVPSNGSITTTNAALAAVQTALDTQLVANGFTAGDVLASADGDALFFETAVAGFDQELEVLTDGASATISGGSALSAGFDFSANNATFDIAIDGGAAQTITLNTASASRQGTVDLVNAALTTAGLNTSVVASLSATNELVFTRVSSGAASSIQISNIDSVGTGASAQLDLSVSDVSGLDGFGLNAAEGLVEGSVRLSETITAQNALFSVNGLNISRASNLVTGVVTGTTINLKGVTAGPVTLAVSKDASSISTRIEEFVSSYNQLKALSDELTAYDTTAGKNGQGSLLTGDSTLRLAMSEINRLLRTSVSGLTGSVRSLSEIGITTDQNSGYQLQFDSVKFAEKFATNSADILAMFATAGSATDSLLTYNSATSTTKPGTYNVVISRLATTGTFTGQSVASLAAGNIVIDANNDQFTVLLNGVSAEIQLVQGTYSTAAALAEHIQTSINSNADLSSNNHRVAVTYNSADQRFELASNTYGASSGIGFLDVENGMANLLGLTSPFQGDSLGNQLGGLSSPNGLSSENFDTAVTLNADTSFVINVNGINSSTLTVPGSSGTPIVYDKPDDLIAALSAQINSDPNFAFTPAQTGTGVTLTAGQDFSAANLSVTLSLDGGTTDISVLVDGDASLVPFGAPPQTPGTIENTLAAVQDAIDATALVGLVTARLDGSNNIFFETTATGASSQIQVAANDMAIAQTNTTGVDGLAVTVSYEYNATSELGRFVFSTANNSDLITFSSVSANAGNKLGLVAGANPRTTSVDGLDVAGTINGVEAVGSGQYLRAASGTIEATPGFYLNTAFGNLASSTITDTFKINVDGIISDSITLGTISNTNPVAVAASMQTAINNSPKLLAAGVSVKVEYDTNTGGFGIISNSTGLSSRVQIAELQGNAGSIFGFLTGAGALGKSGTDASGVADNAYGLRIQVTGGALGARGSVSYIKGVAENMSVLLKGFLDSNGLFATRTSTLTTELESIADKRVKLDERIARSEARLRTSFLANDKIISQLNSTAEFLTSQLQALEALASGANQKN